MASVPKIQYKILLQRIMKTQKVRHKVIQPLRRLMLGHFSWKSHLTESFNHLWCVRRRRSSFKYKSAKFSPISQNPFRFFLELCRNNLYSCIHWSHCFLSYWIVAVRYFKWLVMVFELGEKNFGLSSYTVVLIFMSSYGQYWKITNVKS